MKIDTVEFVLLPHNFELFFEEIIPDIENQNHSIIDLLAEAIDWDYWPIPIATEGRTITIVYTIAKKYQKQFVDALRNYLVKNGYHERITKLDELETKL